MSARAEVLTGVRRWGATPRLSLAIVVLFGVAYALLARLAFHAFPFSGDEYSTLLQAEIFAKGMIRTPAPAHASLFYVDHVVVDDWVRSKYPPGAAALLTLGVLARVPWLVNPIEGALTLACLRHATRVVFGARAALVTVVVAGVSPLFVFNAASFLSHAPLVMWLSLAFAAFANHGCDGRRRWLMVAGAAIGAAFLTRPLDALLFAIPTVLWRRFRVVVWPALFALPALALCLAYQQIQFGGWLTDGYQAYAPTARVIWPDAPSPHQLRFANIFDPDEQWHHLDILQSFCLDWTLPGAILLFIVGVQLARRAPSSFGPITTFALGVFAMSLFAMIFMQGGGQDDGPVPRYLSHDLIVIAFFAGPAWIALEAQLVNVLGVHGSRGVVALMVGLAVASFVSVVGHRTPKLWLRQGLYEAVAEHRLHDAAVIVRAEPVTMYTRNGPTFDRSVLYLRPDVASPEAIAAWFPERTLYEATPGRPWVIRPLKP